MEPVLVVALGATGIAVLAVAVYLIAMARALVRVTSQLQVVLSSVATLSETAPAAGGALDDINTNLAAVQDLLERLPGEGHGEPSDLTERHGEPSDLSERHGEPSDLSDPR